MPNDKKEKKIGWKDVVNGLGRIVVTIAEVIILLFVGALIGGAIFQADIENLETEIKQLKVDHKKEIEDAAALCARLAEEVRKDEQNNCAVDIGNCHANLIDQSKCCDRWFLKQ